MGEESLVKSMQCRRCVQFCVTSRCILAAGRNIDACEALWRSLAVRRWPRDDGLSFQQCGGPVLMVGSGYDGRNRLRMHK